MKNPVSKHCNTLLLVKGSNRLEGLYGLRKQMLILYDLRKLNAYTFRGSNSFIFASLLIRNWGQLLKEAILEQILSFKSRSCFEDLFHSSFIYKILRNMSFGNCFNVSAVVNSL